MENSGLRKHNIIVYSWLIGLAIWSTNCSNVSFAPGGSSGNSAASTPSAGALQSETFGFDSGAQMNKVDFLFVMDNSPSMLPLQANLTSNFSSFINQFVAKGYDFHLAVTTTDAYLALPQFNNDPTLSKFRDGVSGGSHSGVAMITNANSDPVSLFTINASQGAAGSGDERAFSSMKATLDNPLNGGFLRPDSFLAVIILSDEDDFSDPTRPELSWIINSTANYADHNYSDPTLDSVGSYVSYLDTLTGSTTGKRRYNVSTLAVLDPVCLAQHIGAADSALIGTRYISLTNQTQGITASICDTNYGPSLAAIGDRVVQNTQPGVTLKFVPNPSTLTLKIEPFDPDLTYKLVGKTIQFNKAPKMGTKITVQYLTN